MTGNRETNAHTDLKRTLENYVINEWLLTHHNGAYFEAHVF